MDNHADGKMQGDGSKGGSTGGPTGCSTGGPTGCSTGDAWPCGDLLHESYDLVGISREWRNFIHLGARHFFPSGAVIIKAGETMDKLFFLEQGELRLVRSPLDGKEKILFRVRQGMIVGEVPFFDGLPAVSDLVAATNSTVYSFDREVVENRIFPESPKLVSVTMRSMASKIRMLCNQSVDIATVELSTRICRFVVIRARNGGLESQGRVNLALNQQELSSLLGVHRVTLNKALRDLENRGVIGAYSRKSVEIVDEQRLLQLAGIK